jgi:DNA-binding HxlR family transcriptional regulator
VGSGVTLARVRTYGQYCPIARASEVLAERWTPIILRNLLNGTTTFTELADGAPGLSRTLLTSRLRELERVGVVETTPHPMGRGFLYGLTEAGKDLHGVMAAMGKWGERWLELAPEHVDPGMVLHSWIKWYLIHELLPERRVVVRFDFLDLPKKGKRLWVIFHGDDSEICRTDPEFDEDLVVHAQARALAEWHLGRIEWTDAIHAQRIHVSGPRDLARGLPTWNRRSAAARMARIP